MRKLSYTLPLLLLMFCSQKAELDKDILGKWEMKDLMILGADRTKDLNPNMDRWIEFKEDFTFESGGSLGANTGSYQLAGNNLLLDSDAGEGDDSEWRITFRNDSLIMAGIGTERQESSIIYNTRSTKESISISLDQYEIPSSIRAIEVNSNGDLWFAGSEGMWGYTGDSGESWNIQTMKHEGNTPNFRSLEITDSAVMMLSIESPALLFRSSDEGTNWELVYKEEGPGVFYDAIKFWDNQNGIAVGDALNGCLSIIITSDGGKNWVKISCEDLPEAIDGEGFFAASDTNIEIVGTKVWLTTTKSRVYSSEDYGKSWVITDTPISSDKESAGIFSVAFHDKLNGIIMGGNFSEPLINTGNKAVTSDGGKTWTLIADGELPDYRSCVDYVPESGGQDLIAIGFQGIAISKDTGKTWVQLSQAPYYTIRPTGKSTGWLGGNKTIAKYTLHR